MTFLFLKLLSAVMLLSAHVAHAVSLTPQQVVHREQSLPHVSLCQEQEYVAALADMFDHPKKHAVTADQWPHVVGRSAVQTVDLELNGRAAEYYKQHLVPGRKATTFYVGGNIAIEFLVFVTGLFSRE